MLSDILGAVDSGDVAVLVLLDLSAAFDTVDQAILCRRLQVSYGLGGHMCWSGSGLICIGDHSSLRSTWHTRG